MVSVENEVRAANAAFYRAFRDRDVEAMERIWAASAPVVCMHPGMSAVVGRAAVMKSWKSILEHPRSPTLDCSKVEVHLLGTSAYITCLEGVPNESPKLIATNVFTLEEGRWRLCHHQAAPLSPTALQPRKASKAPPDPSTLN